MHLSLWAPWRLSYLRSLESQAKAAGREEGGDDGDFLREIWERPDLDEENFVVLRDEDGLVLLNRFPYANGHLLVALGDARPTLLDYDAPGRAAFWRLLELGVELCRRGLQPQGVNIGINEGRAAGAGVPMHLHAHIVPRWHGDTNFMSAIGEVRVIPDSLERMASRYREALDGARR